ncbi:hypothetical protein [Streptomyces angustmyceticus]|uniref:hypothetical protein n=1 Tax=Streptomyces angustmyceticus TaxID=285578 RepID=UPI00382B269A
MDARVLAHALAHRTDVGSAMEPRKEKPNITQPAEWRFVKKCTADPAGGAVYVNDDRTRYRRTGGEALAAEAAYQRRLAGLGYPIAGSAGVHTWGGGHGCGGKVPVS